MSASPFGEPASDSGFGFADFSAMNPSTAAPLSSAPISAASTVPESLLTQAKGSAWTQHVPATNSSRRQNGSDSLFNDHDDDGSAVIEIQDMSGGGATVATGGGDAGGSGRVKINFWELSLWDLDSGDPRSVDYALSVETTLDRTTPMATPSRLRRLLITSGIVTPAVTRKFLSDVCGSIEGGKFTCVAAPYRPMAQAFVNLLAGTKTHGELEGQLVVQYRGAPRESAEPGSVGFLEASHDSLLRNLTVREYLYLAACNRSSAKTSRHAIMEKVTKVIHEFRLERFAAVKMAGGIVDSAIGRLNESLVLLASELLGDPVVLYGDDPLDGLTADDASQYTNFLKQVWAFSLHSKNNQAT